MSAQKALPLTKEEVMMLVKLVEAHPVLFSKATNATNNRLKEVTWAKLTTRFNLMISSSPRKPEQLRSKWENLKKAARKRSQIRMNNLKTGGGNPDFTPPYEALDKVASILRASCDSHRVPFRGTLKHSVAATESKASVIARNRAIAEYYVTKKKNESELAPLKKRKLELEILELEKRFCCDPSETNKESHQ
ncbi:hypothetical protein HF086_011470 [Spodoptera exigua]|uniref:Regulatory protein zeste n=1 Tax=Spodoptera exigua TaxID=7107 RepID=A0A922M553_SPOEX|nr:hypothetical protein HF086_011470 [Spodoptera exigua]